MISPVPTNQAQGQPDQRQADGEPLGAAEAQQQDRREPGRKGPDGLEHGERQEAGADRQPEPRQTILGS
jgi:hypothetical protein